MPWITIAAGFLAEYTTTKVLDYATSKLPGAIRAFVDPQSGSPWWGHTLADRFLLHSLNLREFYSGEALLTLKGLDGKTYELPVVMIHTPKANGELNAQDLRFSLSHEQFIPSPVLDDWRLPIRTFAERDNRLFDGKVVRLAALNEESGHTSVALSPASYFDALATNFAMDYRPEGRTQSLREFVHGPDRRLGYLANDNLVNHIGVVCMIETVDGMLVAQRRSKNVANRANSLSASVSGAVNYTDLRVFNEQEGFGLSVLAHAVFRETLEELGVEPETVVYLGLVRELLRGGKPEFYFYARTQSTLSKVKSMHKQAEGRTESRGIEGFELWSNEPIHHDPSRYQFRQRVVTILENQGRHANLTFVVGTVLVAEHSLRCTGSVPPV